jgi:hypothetical protein
MEDIKANRNCLNQNSQNLQDYQNKTKVTRLGMAFKK